jgi:hypothetical protein
MQKKKSARPVTPVHVNLLILATILLLVLMTYGALFGAK